jgi:hypothetical protein
MVTQRSMLANAADSTTYGTPLAEQNGANRAGKPKSALPSLVFISILLSDT